MNMNSKKSMKALDLKSGRMAMQHANAERARLTTAENIAVGRQMDLEMAIANKTGLVDALTTIPAWKKKELAKKQAVTARLMQNGITPKDLSDAYERGQKDATQAYVNELLPYQQKFFYSAAAIAAHELFGFGEGRITRLLDRVQEIMCEEISTGDIIERAKAETGVDLFASEYTI